MNAHLDLLYWTGLFMTLILQAACVVVVTAGVCLFIRSAQWRRTAWQVAMVSLVLLTVGEVTGVGRGVAEWTTTHVWSGGSETAAAEEASVLGGSPSPGSTLDAAEMEAQEGAEASAIGSQSILWPGLVWLVGSGFILLRLGIARLLCFRITMRTQSAAPNVVGDVESLAQVMGVGQHIRVLQSRSLSGPIAFGLFRPAIVVSESFESDYTPKQRKAILAHELAHLVNRDPLWHLLANLAVALLWWNPLAWWTRHRLCSVSEQCADEASGLIPNGPEALAESLVQLGIRISQTESLINLGMNGSFRSSLGRRVERLLAGPDSGWRPVHRRRQIFIGITGAVALLFSAFGGGVLVRAGAAPTEAKSLGESIRFSWNNSVSGRALRAVPVEPFLQDQSSSPGVRNEKPYFLEIAYGETGTPIPSRLPFDPSTGLPLEASQTIPESLLRQLQRITINVAGDDHGEVRQENGTEVAYEIKEAGDVFDFAMVLKTRNESVQFEIDTNISLSLTETEWLPIGDSSRRSTRSDSSGPTESGPTGTHIVAVRLIRAQLE